MAKKNPRTIRPRQAPIVEMTGEGSSVYVCFNRRGRVADTITLSHWPVLNIDVDRRGEVIGLESVGFKEITIEKLLERAGLKIPASMLARTRYVYVGEPAKAAK